jgi:hypothetical protein
MINVLHGRQGVVPVACRSSRLVPPPWVAAQPSAPVQLVQLLRALGDGASPRPRKKGTRFTLKDSIGLNPHPETLRDYRSKPTINNLNHIFLTKMNFL